MTDTPIVNIRLGNIDHKTKRIMRILTLCILALCGTSLTHGQEIVRTKAYSWHGDTISQGEFMATAPNDREIVSTYSAQPGFRMPISKEWRLKNDISAYPRLVTGNRLHTAIYNMGLDEMVNAVEPDTTLRTGKEWAGVWTRDVSYSILLSMAYLQPEASMVSLRRKVDVLGRIIQDTGSGGAWPVSTDREIWGVAAYEVYKVTGDRDWLRYIYPVVKRSLETDSMTVYDAGTGLVKGETSFIDWREQSHPRWMQCADIFNTEALSTSVVHCRAWQVLAAMASELGDKKTATAAKAKAESIAQGVNRCLWMQDKGHYAMYLYGRDHLIMNPRAETLGESLAILWGIASDERARSITEHNPTTPFGVAIFYPQIADMPAYHNNALWPWVASWWALANARVGNEQGVMQAIGSVFRPAALFCTNKENFNLDNGDIATELNSSNMLWCLSGNLAITHKILFGIEFQDGALAFHPFVPRALAGTRTLTNLNYRGASLDITVSGYGNEIKAFRVNGKEQQPLILARKAKGHLKVEIEMANNNLPEMKLNSVKNAKAPLTPITWLDGKTLCWNPIEYIEHYIVLRDGVRIAQTRSTTYDASVPGEYQVIGVKGTESFASEPRSTRTHVNVEMPGEQTAISSKEAKNKPKDGVKGYSGSGFAETDKSTRLEIPISIDQDGDYSLSFRYANGNGPVNTRNRCAVRTLCIDGARVGTIVLPQRGEGNWDDWGMTNSLHAHLTQGQHTITLEFRPEDENMNRSTNHALVDCMRLTRLD